jgi:hypothetical protein
MVIMKIKGINYDVGTIMGVDWRPDYNPQTVERELEIIKNDLHCNAVGISGRDIGRVMLTAEAALNQGLEAWLNPADWTNIPPEQTLAYIAEAAKAAQPLYQRYPDKVVFSVGSEFTLFMQGIVPGKTFMHRLQTAFSDEYQKLPDKRNKPLNDFLAQVSKAVRAVFDGPIMYRSLVWEEVDWTNFDFIGVDHYWAEKIKDKYIDMVKPLFTHDKPVINTGFGFSTTTAPANGVASTLGNVTIIRLALHQQPGIGRFIRPKLKVIDERSEALQAQRLIDNLKLVDKAGFEGAFIDMFIYPVRPYSDTPKYDLDRESSSVVKYFEGERHGTTYPDMAWEPKEAFTAVARYYGKEK